MLIKVTQKFEHFETYQELKSHEKRNVCGNFELSWAAVQNDCIISEVLNKKMYIQIRTFLFVLYADVTERNDGGVDVY